MQLHTTEDLNKSFLEEYNSPESVRKYSTGTAGYGINYLLQHDYADVYMEAVNLCTETSRGGPLRLLEFGCGAGMNMIRLLSLLERKGIPVAIAYGTDFSAALVQSARQEARAFLPPALRERTSFHVARNESLGDELTAATGVSRDSLDGTFDLILGVNTFRYCHRLKKEQDCASEIHRLLRPGGICVNIDMNDRFPLFRSRLKATEEKPEECYLPSLDEYASPFQKVGFTLLRKENFCWIPHSAGPALTFVTGALTPMLNAVARRHAMRSLIVARKPL